MQVFFHQSVKGTEEKNSVNIKDYRAKYFCDDLDLARGALNALSRHDFTFLIQL